MAVDIDAACGAARVDYLAVGVAMKGNRRQIIAGAGSGKTNTLAHRVAHLIVKGADPRRILLMTFSRRAASEMTRRVERIAAKVLGDKASIMTEGLTWAGTFHAIGARQGAIAEGRAMISKRNVGCSTSP